MQHRPAPWSLTPGLFSTFFAENPKAFRAFLAALMLLSETRIHSCILRSPAFPASGSLSSLGAVLYTDEKALLNLDVRVFDKPIFPYMRSPSHRVMALDGNAPLPDTPFLLVDLFFSPSGENRCFYGELAGKDALLSHRFLNLSSPAPAVFRSSPLYGFSRLLLLRSSRELGKLADSFPYLNASAASLEDYLKERELSHLFREKLSFSQKDAEGLNVMCSLNRLLLRENRLSDLKAASQNPLALAYLYREYREKGLLH